MKKVYISHYTFAEVKELAEKNPTVLIPLGTTETQNLHNPTGYDYLVAQRLAEEVAKKSDAVVAPVLPYGYSEIFRGYSGTLSLRSETLQSVFEDIATSLIESGFTKILFVNNHDPNHAILGHALTKIRDKFGIVCASVWPTTLARHFAQDQFENANEVLVHGNEPSTSLIKYLYPEYMRMDLVKDSPRSPERFQNFELGSPSNLRHEGQIVPIFLRVKDVSEQGGFGSPQGDAEKGKIIFDKMVNYLVSFVKKYNEMDSKLE